MSKNHGTQQNEQLERGLEERHVQLIAIGGTIGVGLFLGSATAIKMAGPGLLLSYLLGGIVIFFIMRALGEVAVEEPVAGSFSAYANKYINPFFGYLTGWSYWLVWITICMAEITAIGIYVNFWIPTFPRWLSALIAVALMTLVNMIAVKLYGEFEFWFAIIKVVTIVVMIIIGLLMICFGIGNAGKPIGISNLWTNGGFLPYGLGGSAKALVMVTFAFLGVELIGITAGEAKNPDKVIPSAINKVFYRVLIFYLGALFVIMSLYPWNKLGTIGSPFVLTFSRLGIASAAGIINFVVLTAAASACNSGIYTSSRMLYNLSLQGAAPKSFSKISKTQVPFNALLTSAGFMLIGVVLNLVLPAKAFDLITSVSTSIGIFAWGVIVSVQMCYRKKLSPERLKKLKFPMPFYPFGNYLCFAFILFVVIVMTTSTDNLLCLLVGVIWLALLTIAYFVFGLKNKIKMLD